MWVARSTPSTEPNCTVTLALTDGLPSIRVSGVMANVRVDVSPSAVRLTVIRLDEIAVTLPEKYWSCACAGTNGPQATTRAQSTLRNSHTTTE